MAFPASPPPLHDLVWLYNMTCGEVLYALYGWFLHRPQNDQFRLWLKRDSAVSSHFFFLLSWFHQTSTCTLWYRTQCSTTIVPHSTTNSLCYSGFLKAVCQLSLSSCGCSTIDTSGIDMWSSIIVGGLFNFQFYTQKTWMARTWPPSVSTSKIYIVKSTVLPHWHPSTKDLSALTPFNFFFFFFVLLLRLVPRRWLIQPSEPVFSFWRFNILETCVPSTSLCSLCSVTLAW